MEWDTVSEVVLYGHKTETNEVISEAFGGAYNQNKEKTE